MQRTLSQSQLYTILHALRVAADTFDKDAQASTHDARLAEQFKRQQKEALALHAQITEANYDIIIPADDHLQKTEHACRSNDIYHRFEVTSIDVERGDSVVRIMHNGSRMQISTNLTGFAMLAQKGVKVANC